MTKDEAEEILAGICRDERQLFRDPHYWNRVEKRGYSLEDAYAVLRHGKLDGLRYDEKYKNHVARMLGKSSDGRETRIAISLYRVGPCWLISIVDVKHQGRLHKGKRKKRGKQ